MILVSTVFAGAAGLHAQFLWTGLGANNNLSTTANWQGGVAPVGTGSEDLTFGDSPRSSVLLPASFSVRDISITAAHTFYFLGSFGDDLTLTGNVTSSVGSSPFLVFSQSTLTLAAGSHQFNAQGADFYLFGNFAGSGSLVKTGTSGLNVVNYDVPSTYTGAIDLQQGDLRVAGDGVLGSGALTIHGGRVVVTSYDYDLRVTLYNSLLLASGAVFGDGFTSSQLTFTGPMTALGGVTNAVIEATANIQLTFSGNIGETTPGTSFTFDGAGGVLLNGTNNTYTGGTVVTGGTVIFGASAVPATGSLKVTGTAYLGSQSTTNLQAGFLDHFDQINTTGIIGFDSPDPMTPAIFSENIDLAGFDSSVRFGTATAAIFDGTITPQGSTYWFGGPGVLTVTSGLTGSREVYVNDGLQLILKGSNDYDGGTYANTGAIVFDSLTAIPASGLLNAGVRGYVGYTETAELTPAAFLANFNLGAMAGVVGFDSTLTSEPRVVTDDIDLTGFNSGVFIGTSTAVVLGNAITITPANTDYRFTGFRSGQLIIDTVLSGSYNTVIGLAWEDIYGAGTPSVTLNGDNSYTGGTTLQSGELVLGHVNALGSGPLQVAYFDTAPTGLSTGAPGLIIANNIDFGGNYDFSLGGAYDFTLSGALSSLYGSMRKVGDQMVTLSGNNSGLNSEIDVWAGRITFASNTAAGNGPLLLWDPITESISEAYFTSAAPVVGTLQGEGVTVLHLDTTGSLTINQSYDASFDGTITGTGGINKSGTSTLTFRGTNDYQGNTVLNQGTLVAGNNSALGAGTIVFNGGRLSLETGVVLANPISFGGGGGTLGGNGTFNVPVSVGTNADLSPGNSVGLLSFTGGLTWAPGGTYDVEIQSATGARGVGYDSIDVTGGLTFTATLGTPFTLNLLSLNAGGSPGAVADFDSGSTYTWQVAQADTLTGFDPANVSIVTTGFANSLAGGSFYVFAAGNNVYVTFVAVPEPSTYALLGLGVVVVFAKMRRRRT